MGHLHLISGEGPTGEPEGAWPGPAGRGAPTTSFLTGRRSGRVAAVVVTRLCCLACPYGHHEKLKEYLLGELGKGRHGEVGPLLADALRHLRRHGVAPVAGLALLGLGTIFFAFTATSWGSAVVWGLAGTGVIVALPTLLRRPLAVRGGCPYSLEPALTAGQPHSCALGRVAGPLGATLLVAPAVVPVQGPFYNPLDLSGILLCGLGLLAIAFARGGDLKRLFAAGIRLTALGTLVVAVADASLGLIATSKVIGLAASAATAVGGILYAAFAQDLLRDPPDRRAPLQGRARARRARAA